MSSLVPQEQPRPYRLSDAERSEAISILADAFAEGRLDAEEFDSRMGAATQARFAADLDPLFADLPQRGPALTRPATPHPRAASMRSPQHAHVRARRACRGLPMDEGRHGPRIAAHPFVFLPLIVLIVASTQLWFFLPLLFLSLGVLNPGYHPGRGRLMGPPPRQERRAAREPRT